MDNNKSIAAAVLGLLAVVVIGGVLVFSGENEEVSTNESSDAQNTQQSVQTDPTPQSENEQTPTSSIVELAQATEALSVLVSAVVEAELVDTLSSEGPFTVFAPTNDAFSSLLASLDITAEELLARDDLADILTYHVVAGKVMAADLSDGQVVTTVQGEKLTVSIDSDGVTLTDANGGTAMVATADVEASNGVVHVIDSVVLPKL